MIMGSALDDGGVKATARLMTTHGCGVLDEEVREQGGCGGDRACATWISCSICESQRHEPIPCKACLYFFSP